MKQPRLSHTENKKVARNSKASCHFGSIFNTHLELLLESNAIVILLLQTKQFLLHFLGYTLHLGITIEIMHLCGIVLQIIEFPSIIVVVEVHELVAVATHTIVTAHAVFSGIFVVVIVDTLAPVFGMRGAGERAKRLGYRLVWEHRLILRRWAHSRYFAPSH